MIRLITRRQAGAALYVSVRGNEGVRSTPPEECSRGFQPAFGAGLWTPCSESERGLKGLLPIEVSDLSAPRRGFTRQFPS